MIDQTRLCSDRLGYGWGESIFRDQHVVLSVGGEEKVSSKYIPSCSKHYLW